MSSLTTDPTGETVVLTESADPGVFTGTVGFARIFGPAGPMALVAGDGKVGIYAEGGIASEAMAADAAGEVMAELVRHCDIAVANEEDAEKVFGIAAPGANVEGGQVDASAYEAVGRQLMDRFPSLSKVAITLRGSLSASHNTWSGLLYAEGAVYAGPTYNIAHIVDRVGGGDSFRAGLIHSVISGRPSQQAIDFAVAASCLKHSIHGDFDLVTASEVEALLKSGGSGRVQR